MYSHSDIKHREVMNDSRTSCIFHLIQSIPTPLHSPPIHYWTLSYCSTHVLPTLLPGVDAVLDCDDCVTARTQPHRKMLRKLGSKDK